MSSEPVTTDETLFKTLILRELGGVHPWGSTVKISRSRTIAAHHQQVEEYERGEISWVEKL